MLISVAYKGTIYSNCDAEYLLSEGVPQSVISETITETKWSAVRVTRNELISACDWTQANDSPLTAEQKAAWAEYRQALRDIPDVYDDIVWPEKPTL